MTFYHWICSLGETQSYIAGACIQEVKRKVKVSLILKCKLIKLHLFHNTNFVDKHIICLIIFIITICPRSSDPFHIVTYYMKWVTTSWTYSISKSYFRSRCPWQNVGDREGDAERCAVQRWRAWWTSTAGRTALHWGYKIYTVCPGSSYPFYIASLLYKMGHYFLDILYNYEFDVFLVNLLT